MSLKPLSTQRRGKLTLSRPPSVRSPYRIDLFVDPGHSTTPRRSGVSRTPSETTSVPPTSDLCGPGVPVHRVGNLKYVLFSPVSSEREGTVGVVSLT